MRPVATFALRAAQLRCQSSRWNIHTFKQPFAWISSSSSTNSGCLDSACPPCAGEWSPIAKRLCRPPALAELSTAPADGGFTFTLRLKDKSTPVVLQLSGNSTVGDVLSTVRAAVNVDAVPVFLDEENDVVSGSTKFCLVADQRWSLRWGDAVVCNTALSVAVGSGKSASVLGGDALVAALRAQFESTAARLSTLTAELTSTESTVKDMQNILDVAKESARRRIRNLSILAGAGMAAQWGVIYYLVYSESWDVMEPICYFISTGYGLLFYTLFFLPTKRDPTVSGIFGHLSRTSTERALLRMPQAKQWKSLSEFEDGKNALQESQERLKAQIDRLKLTLPPETIGKN